MQVSGAGTVRRTVLGVMSRYQRPTRVARVDRGYNRQWPQIKIVHCPSVFRTPVSIAPGRVYDSLTIRVFDRRVVMAAPTSKYYIFFTFHVRVRPVPGGFVPSHYSAENTTRARERDITRCGSTQRGRPEKPVRHRTTEQSLLYCDGARCCDITRSALFLRVHKIRASGVFSCAMFTMKLFYWIKCGLIAGHRRRSRRSAVGRGGGEEFVGRRGRRRVITGTAVYTVFETTSPSEGYRAVYEPKGFNTSETSHG